MSKQMDPDLLMTIAIVITVGGFILALISVFYYWENQSPEPSLYKTCLDECNYNGNSFTRIECTKICNEDLKDGIAMILNDTLPLLELSMECQGAPE